MKTYASRAVVLLCLLGLVVALQVEYDKTAVPFGFPQGQSSTSPEIIRIVDLGFHSTVGSFLWIGTMPEIIDLFRKRTEYLQDVAFINAIDPKLSYPYAFSVLTLPAIPPQVFPDGVKDALAIGAQGIAQSDPDWRIPYYMATNYYLNLKDQKSALEYYDIAARTPGVPDFARRFATNFGIGDNERDTTIKLWESIRDTTNDDFTKARAQAYVDRLNMFNYLDAASAVYKKRFGSFPASPDDLVAKKIIPAVPEDPFGYTFIINSNGQAGIDLTKIPTDPQTAIGE